MVESIIRSGPFARSSAHRQFSADRACDSICADQPFHLLRLVTQSRRHGRTVRFRDPCWRPSRRATRLRRDVLAIDAVDDLVDLEGRKRPVDRRPRRFDRIALAAKFVGDAPADLKARPARRTTTARRARQTCRSIFPRPRTCRSHAAPNVRPSPPRCASRPSRSVTGLPSAVMKRAVPGSDSIAVFGGNVAPRHGRRIRRSVSMTGPSACGSVTPGLSGAIIGFPASCVLFLRMQWTHNHRCRLQETIATIGAIR